MKNKKGKATIYIIIFIVLLFAFVGYAIYDNYTKQVKGINTNTKTTPKTTLTTPVTTNPNPKNIVISSRMYPNKVLTPGFVLTYDSIFLCNPGTPQGLEKNTSVDVMKQLFSNYQLSYPPNRKYQIDRFIPISLGGSPDNIKNLWPQSDEYPGYEEKNQAEQYLYKLMCNRTINITVAQARIKSDWVKVYQECCTK